MPDERVPFFAHAALNQPTTAAEPLVFDLDDDPAPPTEPGVRPPAPAQPTTQPTQRPVQPTLPGNQGWTNPGFPLAKDGDNPGRTHALPATVPCPAKRSAAAPGGLQGRTIHPHYPAAAAPLGYRPAGRSNGANPTPYPPQGLLRPPRQSAPPLT
ncbi:MAG: hypothetical protein U0452_11990 [Anaerolineae bacterium]